MMRSAGIYLSARVVASLLGLVAVIIYTRLLEPETYGLYALLITAVFALFEILFRWIGAGATRFLPAQPSIRSPMLGAAISGFLMAGMLVLLVSVVLLSTETAPVSPRLLILSTAVLLAHAACEVTLNVIQARQKPALYGIVVAGRALGVVGLGTLMVLLDYGVEGLLIGTLIANTAPVALLAARRGRDLLASRCEIGKVRTFAAFGLPMAIVGVSATCISLSDRYVIAALLGVDAAGMYSAPYDLAFRSLTMVMLGCFLAVSPLVFRSYDAGNQAEARQHMASQAALHLVVGLPLALILACAAPLVSRIAFGTAFRETASELMPWFAAAAFLQGLQAFYLSYLFTIHRRTLWNAGICLVAAAVNLALNFALVPLIGVVGAAIATLLSYALVMIASVLVARRWMVLPWPRVDMVKVLFACAAAAPLALASRLRESAVEALLLTAGAVLVASALLALTNSAGIRSELVGALRRWRMTQPNGRAETLNPVR